MLSPYISKWGTYMLQSWILGFNHDNPCNLAFPTWISLRNMPHEHLDEAYNIVEMLGEIIGTETTNERIEDPKSCINMQISKG